jgi:transcriptional regulator with PAS, ATPase and Fis domain
MEIRANSSSKTSAGNRNKDRELKHSLQFFEKNIIEDVLKRVKCNKTITSRELGISRATLNNKIEKFSIDLNSLSIDAKFTSSTRVESNSKLNSS